jgi:hypothetical protein
MGLDAPATTQSARDPELTALHCDRRRRARVLTIEALEKSLSGREIQLDVKFIEPVSAALAASTLASSCALPITRRRRRGQIMSAGRSTRPPQREYHHDHPDRW